ncbi:MAG TPA: glycosyl hydrolase [Candidatus Anammoximicrobium sp.]|nr:glycosyl hydrolase [Candidatus Anammoximicrobium sp.]
MRTRLIFAALLPTLFGGLSPAADGLERGFVNPPASAKPWTYFFVMDGNLTREGITADFEAIARAGLGGVLFMEVNVGIPRGPVEFMSPQWRQLFKHAVAEAERLGLQLTLNAGPGWTGSGGPWVKPEQSMQHVVASAADVVGPKRFDETLPRPQRHPAFFGDGHLPADLEKVKNEFYRDLFVLAFPTPAGEARIADIDEKALYVRAPYSSQPNVKAFLPTAASYPPLPAESVIASDRSVDLTDKLDGDGRLVWDVPEGRWTILRFGATSTGATTRPAPAPGLGLECDKLDKAALDAHFEAFIGTLLREIGPRLQSPHAGWNMLHIDSWEMGAANWTAAFRDEFRRRRGYDPLHYLPTITGRVVDSLEISERFLWDLRQTAKELVIANHAQHLKELGRRHGFGLSIEPYDMTPCADMSLGGVADVPMCEFWLYGFNTSFSVIQAASIAHTCGRPVVAAEAFTSSAAERWQAHPGSVKSLGDWAFCTGVNRIVFHRYQHQPQLDRWPGMTFGPYGVHWERTQTWWNMAPAYHAYLARCQFLLRQGLPVADVCYLVAEGAPHVFRPPTPATRGNPPDRPGYNFDGCAPETLLERMSVQDGRLVLPDGMSYRVLVLPKLDTMTPGLVRKVKELVDAGATVVGPRPLKSPGLSGYPSCDDEIRQLAAELWGDCDGKKVVEHNFGKGRVVWDAGPQETLAEDKRNPLDEAKWIWYPEGQPAASAPVGKRFFRRVVDLKNGAKVATARVFMTADNSFTLFVNGNEAGDGGNFHETYSMDVSSLLKPGVNVLAVAAENGGETPNPAGLIGALVVKFGDGRELRVPTDRTWQSAPTAGSGWATGNAVAGWAAAMELGPRGMAPWRHRGEVVSSPEQYGDFAVVAGVLSKMGILPDFESDRKLRYIHRHTSDADIYFIANGTNEQLSAGCTFRVWGKAPEIWDPVTGAQRPAAAYQQADGRTTVPLEFAPNGSLFVVFRKPTDAAPANGRNFPEFKTLQELAGPWTVHFDLKWGGPTSIEFPALISWSAHAEDGVKFYSGTAMYRKTFPLQAKPQSGMVLDLGKVQVMAQVRLNGKDLGVVWTPPYRVDISDAAKVGENTLEISVANLWPNRLIGDQSLPPEKRLTSTTWNPFPKDAPLLESGLLGPVTLQVEQ